MLDAGGGKVIFMSSNAAKKGFANDAGYSVAKAGLMALTRVLAVEYGTRGIETFCVHPGLVAETDMGESVVVDHITRPRVRRRPREVLGLGEPAVADGLPPDGQGDRGPASPSSPGPGQVLTGPCLTADHGFTPY